jgi:hypothetical protein
VYAFRFHSRVASNMGAIGATATAKADSSAQAQLPYLTAEIGGGLEDTYHRRVVVQPDDIAAMYPVMLGSGVNLYGTYMFQGGENPDGKLTTLQESQATGYPNDVPVKSYDFQAPLGEFGDERASFRKMKVFQYFLNDFGGYLAPMTVHGPDQQAANPGDLSVPRVSVRSRGDAGFVFFNNYVRNYPMPQRRSAQFEVRLPNGTIRVPSRPVDIPSGSYFIWPFNLRCGGVTIRYSTAQLFTRIETGGATILYFVAIPGIPVEFAFDPSTVGSLKVSSGHTNGESGSTIVTGVEPGVDSFLDLTAPDGKKTRLVVLTQPEAENAWKVRLGASASPAANHLLITAHDFFADPAAGRISLRSRGNSGFAFTITPPVSSPPHSDLPLTQAGSNASAARFAAKAVERKLDLHYSVVQLAGDAPPVALGPTPDWRPHGVAQSPGEDDPPYEARWSINVPPDALKGLNELYLQVNYRGDLARLNAGDRLLTDNFYNGEPWIVGLRRFIEAKTSSFDLSILPLRRDAPVYFELTKDPGFGPNGQVGAIDDMRLIPEYELVLTATTP